jgi:curved DNA-binding protein CbpA
MDLSIPRDHYAILGIPPTASARVIQDAFRKLAQRFHPDHAGEEGTRLFQEILQAYEVLSDPAQRHRYNQSLEQDSESAHPIIVPRPPHPQYYGARSYGTAPEPLIRQAKPEAFSEAAPRETIEKISGPRPSRIYIWLPLG